MNFLRRYLGFEEEIPEVIIPETRRPSEEFEDIREEIKEEVRPRRRILTRAEVLGDIEGSVDPFGIKRERRPVYNPPKKDEIFEELEIDENIVISGVECNDPITLEHQDEDSKKFIEEDDSGDHFLLIGKIDDRERYPPRGFPTERYYIDCAYRSTLRNILNSHQYRCTIDNKVYYTVTTSFDPYLKISQDDIQKMISSTHKIYYILPTEDRCGNGRIFNVKICGGERCLEKIFN